MAIQTMNTVEEFKAFYLENGRFFDSYNRKRVKPVFEKSEKPGIDKFEARVVTSDVGVITNVNINYKSDNWNFNHSFTLDGREFYYMRGEEARRWIKACEDLDRIPKKILKPMRYLLQYRRKISDLRLTAVLNSDKVIKFILSREDGCFKIEWSEGQE